MPECFPTVTPKLAVAPQAASEVDQTRSRGYCCIGGSSRGGGGVQGVRTPHFFSKILGIDFYSGSKKKKLKGGGCNSKS